MTRRILAVGAGALLAIGGLTAATIPSSPDLGKKEGQCRSGETGPALIVDIDGLKDRMGRLKLEVYPAVDVDFLADDNVLIAAGKTFRRVEMAVPATGAVHMCVRLPGPGKYAVSVLHDRNSDRHFNLSKDGVGFGGNPRLGMRQPKASEASVVAGSGLTPMTIVMNYRHGLLSFGPLDAKRR
ncbi:DUF2141 domain-containing protein [Sphingorhabdus soli]|uniref:DUF2141 domain-containing protein n=1 Tax=Flavisphingopyxis soli TaxID=2601267 RepID=A0A5C6UAE7_9SPHN|nr:DUF2141 domain-containing protein [Sphingorhabdus soli]TXC68658.1 DUF2141 domain-containing protein [Sphingorhabdus soli]